jgi:hypothetical protein
MQTQALNLAVGGDDGVFNFTLPPYHVKTDYRSWMLVTRQHAFLSQDFPSNLKMEGTVDFSMCQVANVGIAVTVALRTDSIRVAQAAGQSGT